MGNATCIDPDPAWGSAWSYTHRGRAMLLIGEGDAIPAAQAAIDAVGGRLLRRIAWHAVATDLPDIAAVPVVLIEVQGVDDATLDAVLPAIGAFLDGTEAPVVVALAAAQIDIVAAHLCGPHTDLLCDPTPGDRIAALALAAQHRPLALHDSLPDTVQDEREPYRYAGPETDDQRLRRLTDGMAHIARYAADLTRLEVSGRAPQDIADRRRAFGSEPAALPQVPDGGVTAQEVRRLIQLRRLRGKFFGQFIGEGLFEDPAWDMLLDLFAAELEGNRVSVSSLCIAAGVAPTTALRWIARMTEMGLFIRHPDPVDRRRAFMALSARAGDAMRAYIVAARKVETG